MTVHDGLIMQWHNACQRLDAVKKEELEFRKLILYNIFNHNPAELRKTTDKLILGRGWELKAGFTVSYKLNKDFRETLTQIAQINAFLAGSLVVFEPKLSPTDYEKLQNPQIKALADSIVTPKPAMPTLKLIGPK